MATYSGQGKQRICPHVQTGIPCPGFRLTCSMSLHMPKNSSLKVPTMKAEPCQGMRSVSDWWEGYLCRLRRQCTHSRTPI